LQQKRTLCRLGALLAFTWAIAAVRWAVARWVWMSSGGRLELGVMAAAVALRRLRESKGDGSSKIKSFRAGRRESLLSWQK
jgi:hypothetical protein